MRTLGLVLFLCGLVGILVFPLLAALLAAEEKYEQPHVAVTVPSHAEKLSHGLYRVEGENVTTLYHLRFSGDESRNFDVSVSSEGGNIDASVSPVGRNANASSSSCRDPDSLGCCRFIGFTHKQGGYQVEIRRPPTSQYDQALRQVLAE